MGDYVNIDKQFTTLCTFGTSNDICAFLTEHRDMIDDWIFGHGFYHSCMSNLDNAKWLYNNYKIHRDKYFMGTNCFFARDVIHSNREETFTWLKSLHNKAFDFQVELAVMEANLWAELAKTNQH